MSQIKIISDPYKGIIEYLVNNPSSKYWEPVSNAYSGLMSTQLHNNVFPEIAEMLANIIAKEYCIGSEKLTVYFEGTKDEYEILSAICKGEEYSDKLRLDIQEKYLNNVESIISPLHDAGLKFLELVGEKADDEKTRELSAALDSLKESKEKNLAESTDIYSVYKKCGEISKMVCGLYETVHDSIRKESEIPTGERDDIQRSYDSRINEIKEALKTVFDKTTENYLNGYDDAVKNISPETCFSVTLDELKTLRNDLLNKKDDTRGRYRADTVYGKAIRYDPNSVSSVDPSYIADKNVSADFVNLVADKFYEEIRDFASDTDKAANDYKEARLAEMIHVSAVCIVQNENDVEDVEKAVSELCDRSIAIDLKDILDTVSGQNRYRFSGMNISDADSPELEKLRRRYDFEIKKMFPQVYNIIKNQHKLIFNSKSSELLNKITDALPKIEPRLNKMTVELFSYDNKLSGLEAIDNALKGCVDEIYSLVSWQQ